MKAFQLFRNNVHIQDEAIRLISEFVHHTRAGLDYIVFALVLTDSKTRIERTKFPIYKCKKLFAADRSSRKPKSQLAFLHRLTDKHVALIERFQPYNGFDSLSRLQGLSNIDKHREFVRFNFIGSYWEGADPIVETNANLAGREVRMNAHPTFHVLFDDGTRVEKSLQQLHALVSEILNEFDTIK